MEKDIDLKSAINAISDVVQNRPRPLREHDQIYMKAGDMVLQSELIASWSDGKELAFIGDGDAISVCVAYLKHRGILEYGPKKIIVFDFDDRICSAINRFADKERIRNLSSQLYNCIDPFPAENQFDCFYTNPPWGASNDGDSVLVFLQRGIEAVGYSGEGVVIIADDHELEWPQKVLATTQSYALKNNFYVQRMASRLHLYHVDDDPGLRSCNLFFKALPNNLSPGPSTKITNPERLKNFYGLDKGLQVQYIREKKRVDYGKAHDDEYYYEYKEND